MKYSFARTTGHEDAKAFLIQALTSGKFPHALLIHGPEGVGQNALLLDLADILLCESAETRPCGKCGSCLQGRSGNGERIHFMLPLKTSGGDEDSKDLEGAQMEELGEKIRSFLGDPYGFPLEERAMIRIVQSRDLHVKLGYAGTGGKARVVVVPWAETFNISAANALLKTLEEPPAAVYFLLATSNRKALLQTILSRCTSLPLPALEDAAFAAAVRERKAWWADLGGEPPARLLPFAEGSLGALLHLHRNGGEALLDESLGYLDAALQSDWRTFSDWLDASAAFDKMDTAAPLLAFLLRAARALHRLRVETGESRPSGWITQALARRGWDPSLAPLFAALDRETDLREFSALVEGVLAAVQDYAKPRMAALGAWLEREGRNPAATASASLSKAAR